MPTWEIYNKGERWPIQIIEAHAIRVCPPRDAPLCVFYMETGKVLMSLALTSTQCVIPTAEREKNGPPTFYAPTEYVPMRRL
jgi:hypothetical protein